MTKRLHGRKQTDARHNLMRALRESLPHSLRRALKPRTFADFSEQRRYEIHRDDTRRFGPYQG
jgi:hypothetical protein